MANAAKKTATPKQDKPKRKMLTPAERVKRAEDELKRAQAAAKAKAEAAKTKLIEKRSALVVKGNTINKQIIDIDAELTELGFGDDVAELTAVVDEPPAETIAEDR